MKKIKILAGFFGLILPIGLTLLNNGADSCRIGPLHFLRGANAYITTHGSSYGYNNNFRIDDLIIGVVTLILLLIAFMPPRGCKARTLIGRLLLIAFILFIDFVLIVFIGLTQCLEF